MFFSTVVSRWRWDKLRCVASCDDHARLDSTSAEQSALVLPPLEPISDHLESATDQLRQPKLMDDTPLRRSHTQIPSV
ncbi:hypothetical protein H6758_03730 [Candidatus Nomurabacteria bacterium]|nr:hypothetical protein [Candidatus Nomurabacteria bacterium]